MKITRRSPLTGKEVTLELDITQEELSAWEDGELVQLAFPRLNVDEREFMLTGLAPGEWEKIFAGADEDEDIEDTGSDSTANGLA
jgi:hypothetical protein